MTRPAVTLLSAATLLCAGPALAAVDCAKLTGGATPFQLVSKQGDRTTAMQVAPDGKGGAIVLLAAGDTVVRQRFANGFLVASRRVSPREDLRLKIETNAGDAYAGKKNFAYDETIHSSGLEGTPAFDIQMATQATYVGEEDKTIAACRFHLLHYKTRSEAKEPALTTGGEGGGPTHSQVTEADKLYSPDLHMVLSTKSKVIADGKAVSDTTFDPSEIETGFAPIKDPGE